MQSNKSLLTVKLFWILQSMKYQYLFLMKNIKKVLVANRGEIAVRIIKAAKELGLSTVAIYSEVDKTSLHVRFADECYLVKTMNIEPYLDIPQIVEIAKIAKIDAIHPGYGFLSENGAFAKAVNDAGFVFIGPASETIATMGDKLSAKELAKKSRVPVIPGFEIVDIDEDRILREADKIGYPLLVKARAGGGGKGMRLISDKKDLIPEIATASREADHAFGDGRIFVEKYIQSPKHIEIQILADQYGNMVHLFERDCSIQRRHQKVIEESPSAILSFEKRTEMGSCALDLARSCNYCNAGTVEFVMDREQNFYFLEMNTRLQVEHPVTEMVTGLDLVKEQFKVADGEKLAFEQKDIKLEGHAIELRLYAEDAENNFMPDTGILEKYRPPKGIGVRMDDGYAEGMEVPLEYDPLLAKLITFGKDRSEAIVRMIRAIDEFWLEGVKNTLDFGSKVMQSNDFVTGIFDTNFVAENLEQLYSSSGNDEEMEVAAMLSYEIMKKPHYNSCGNIDSHTNRWLERLKKD